MEATNSLNGFICFLKENVSVLFFSAKIIKPFQKLHGEFIGFTKNSLSSKMI